MIGIHTAPNNFSDRWTAYCDRESIPWKPVDCYASDILEELNDCRGLMWHWTHRDERAQLFARQLCLALESRGTAVFPDWRTCWHYDDKVAQKYLLEAIGAPMIPTTVFYDTQPALEWCATASFPKVFKLRRGAGSANVQLITTSAMAEKVVRRAFRRGFNPVGSYLSDSRRKVSSSLHSPAGLLRKIRRAPSAILSIRRANRILGRERGYVYFQDFAADNDSDTRVIVVGHQAVAIRRMVRPGDFRASGSGRIEYSPSGIDPRCIEIAFDVSRRLGTQCLAFDFVFHGEKPAITEISYCFSMLVYDECPGYWREDLTWHEGEFILQDAMVRDFVTRLGD